MRLGNVALIFAFVMILLSCEKAEIYDPYGQLQTDITIIDQYLEDNNISAIKTSSGLRYVVVKEGIGSIPQRGNQVKVHYEGRLLDGTIFDSSYDRGEAFTYTYGSNQVIRGWEEGLGYIEERGIITLYIPSVLAYGNQARGEYILPNSILVFDVELLSVQ